jgi:hypothetical protein
MINSDGHCSRVVTQDFGATTGEGRAWWATCISYLVVLFPCIDVLSVYPLNTIILASNVISTLYAERADRAEHNVVIVRFWRFACAVPPIICAWLFPHLGKVVDYTGAICILISFIVPPYLNYASTRELARVRDANEPPVWHT